MNSTSYMAPPEISRWQQHAMVVGGIALVICAAAGYANPAQFFRSYLLAFLFCAGLALGCLALLMLQHLFGGAWGLMIRRPLESGTRTLPLVALLFVPLALGVRTLYSWSRPESAIPHKAAYLNVPFFLARAVFYFAVWLLLAYLLNKWSRQQDATSDIRLKRKLQLLSGPGLVIYGFLATFAGIDWIMSLDPRWYSSIFGMLVVGGQALLALAFIIAVSAVLARREPLASAFQPRHFHDLGKLMLAFVMIWAYFSFSQLLIMWSGNLPEEIPWYVHRLQGSWRWIGLALVVFHFALPFLLLLSRDLKRRSSLLLGVAVALVLMRLVDLFWLTAPEFSPGGFRLHWMDVLLPIGLGGIWLGFFAWQLQRMPLLPLGDRQLAKALEHEAH